MPVVFEVGEARAWPGEVVSFPFQLRNDSPGRMAYRFALDGEGPLRSARWQIDAPPTVEAGRSAAATLHVTVPTSGARAGRYRLRLSATPQGPAPSASAECRLVVEREPHISLLPQPEFEVNPDGSVTVKLHIAKRGETDLTLSIEVRHGQGWHFECSPPEVHVGTKAGPFDVELTLRPPAGRSAEPGDEITLEVSCRGHVLAREGYRLPSGGRHGSPPRDRDRGHFSVPEILPDVRTWIIALGSLMLAGFVTVGALLPRNGGGAAPAPPSSPSPSPTISPRLAAPAGLRAIALGPAHVHLYWFHAAEAPDSYQVSRDGIAIASVRATIPAYDDTSVRPGQTYHYTVKALRAGTPSPPSNEVPVTTPSGYVPRTHSLAVATVGAGSGTITSNPSGTDCGPVCLSTFADQAAVELTATPGLGSIFAGWHGAGCAGTGPCVVIMKADQSVSAQFDRAAATRSLAIANASPDGGIITSNPSGINCGPSCTSSFPDRTTVTLTATAGPGFAFSGWQGGGCSGSGACTLTLDVDRSVAAGFSRRVTSTATSFTVGVRGPVPRQLTVIKAGKGGGVVESRPAGISCGVTCTATFDDTAVITLTATPLPNSAFAGWEGGGCSGTGRCTFSLPQDQSITARFEPSVPG